MPESSCQSTGPFGQQVKMEAESLRDLFLRFLCAQPPDREDFNFVQVFRGNFSNAEGSDFSRGGENFCFRAAGHLHLEKEEHNNPQPVTQTNASSERMPYSGRRTWTPSAVLGDFEAGAPVQMDRPMQGEVQGLPRTQCQMLLTGADLTAEAACEKATFGMALMPKGMLISDGAVRQLADCPLVRQKSIRCPGVPLPPLLSKSEGHQMKAADVGISGRGHSCAVPLPGMLRAVLLDAGSRSASEFMTPCGAGALELAPNGPVGG
ncbi:hypothetical protein AK812_SmicGene10369 [Symbiodinium microadriaticum]|uniref:Uncharacterized protein n=1 Tax=Symbiodinium microadriaticum TaxID=2951 RepID=A0A1Q9EG30_SYMMI|nr:hypothetical protein AK812_SmicGene10369 [Symbiodinium microadriaticum]